MLSDPAESQRPLSFYAAIVRRHWVMIALLSLGLTALAVLVCAQMPPVNVGSAMIAIDRQAAPEAIGSNQLLSTGDDQFMATQQNLLRADTILRPVTERYNLLEREHQFRRYWFWRYSQGKGECDQECAHSIEASQSRTQPQHVFTNRSLIAIEIPGLRRMWPTPLRIPTFGRSLRRASGKLDASLPRWNGS